MNRKDINFVELYRLQSKTQRENNTPGKIYLVIFLVTTLLLSAFSIKLLIDQNLLKSQVDELQQYVSNPVRQNKLSEINKLQSDLASLKEMNGELSNLTTIMAMIPRFDRDIMNILSLNKPNDTKITNVSYDGEWVVVSVIADHVVSMSNYVLALKRSEMFEDVYYSGYSISGDKYSSVIYVALKGNEVTTNE